jgi:hypothetical protein
LGGLIVDHFKVSVDDFIVEPDAKGESSERSGKKFLEDFEFHIFNKIIGAFFS